MCVSSSEDVNRYVSYAVGGPYGPLLSRYGERSSGSAPKRKFFGSDGRSATVRLNNQRYEALLADPARVESLLATGTAQKGKSVLGG